MKLNKTVKLFVLAIALFCTSCNKESLSNVESENDNATETVIDFGLSISSLYTNDAATKAGGDGDIPDGHTLVARMQIYVEGEDGEYLLYSDNVEYVEGTDADAELSNPDIFKNIRLLACDSYKIFTQLYFKPTDSEGDDTYYIYDSSAKTYVRNYYNETSGVDAEDFYVGDTKIFTLTEGGEIVSESLDEILEINAVRKVSKVSIYASSIGNRMVVDNVNKVQMVYNSFLLPTYNYFTDSVTVSESAEDNVFTVNRAIYNSQWLLTDYTFVPTDAALALDINLQVLGTGYYVSNQTLNLSVEKENVSYSLINGYDDEGYIKGLPFTTMAVD